MAEDNKAGTVFAFLMGMCIGAVAALMLAPKAGEEMLDDLSKAAKNLNRRSQKIVETAKDHLEEAVDEGTEAFKQAKKSVA